MKLLKSESETASDILAGHPLVLRVDFQNQNSLPSITKITYNGKLLCSSTVPASIVTELTLRHTFTMNASPSMYKTTSKRPKIIHPTRSPSSPSANSNLDNECGVPEISESEQTTTGLIINGKEAIRGQFPWLVAYFDQDKFRCGGSLVSKNIVVTAAHCIKYKREAAQKKEENAILYLGKHDIDVLGSERNYVTRSVKKFVIHADWNITNTDYDSDIAVMVMTHAVNFNKFIKPICIWTQTNSFNDIIGVEAQISGWGKTEFNAIHSDVPKFIKVSAVDSISCVRSNWKFSKIISHKTFCAGDSSTTDGAGVCNGDSGKN